MMLFVGARRARERHRLHLELNALGSCEHFFVRGIVQVEIDEVASGKQVHAIQ